MASVRQIQPQEGITRLQDGKEDRHVCLGSGVGLHVSVFCIEEFLQPVNCELFNLVNNLASAVISCPGVAFRVLVGKYGSHCFKHLGADEILRCDKFNTFGLAFAFAVDQFKYCAVSFHDKFLRSVDKCPSPKTGEDGMFTGKYTFNNQFFS